jgi:hypothetical protein
VLADVDGSVKTIGELTTKLAPQPSN